MKKPNKLFQKKYISSLVVAAFLILSVLTAYNIKMGSENPEDANTEVEETIGPSQDLVSDSAGENETESEQTGNNRTKNSRPAEEETEDAADSEEENKSTAGQTDELAAEDQMKDRREGNQDRNTTEDDQREKNRTAEEETDTAEGENDRFETEKKLTWPVMGNVILPYSMDTTVYYTTLDQYACNDGILIGAKAGEEVVAAADGSVVNISDSDRYGTTVTVLLGDYYEVEYSQIDNVKYSIGDKVKEGEVIATVAEPTRSFILEGPHLFFKMTYKGETVNPTNYLK